LPVLFDGTLFFLRESRPGLLDQTLILTTLMQGPV
jgi:hypothetical protein